MLTINLVSQDGNNYHLDFEHSLVSLSKWESIYEKAFFGKNEKTHPETLSYIQHMLVSDNAPRDFLSDFNVEDFVLVNNYINSKQSATWFNEDPNARPSSEIVTTELVYFWMINFQIPFDPCENWHFARLMNLIKICGIKQTKPKKMSKQAQMEQYRALNAQRREQLGTTG